MKTLKSALIAWICLAAAFAFADTRHVQKLDGEGWNLWLDRDAKYQDDTLYINKSDIQKIKDGKPDWLKQVDVKEMKAADPTCGWENLFSKTADWREAEMAWKDKSISLKVSVPSTVE